MSKHTPPGWALRFLKWFCPDDLYEEIEGDLIERFEKDVVLYGERRSRRRMVWSVIRFFRPAIIMRNSLSYNSSPYAMYRNYLKVSLRQIRKNKIFTAINVAGLALAMSSTLLIAEYVTLELNYDTFLANKDRIFRVQQDLLKDGVLENQWAPNVGMLGPALKEDFHEVEECVQVFPYKLATAAPVVEYDGRTFMERETYFASDRFFRIFSVKLLAGVDTTILNRVNTIVLSRSTAKKYFGETDPIGKVLRFDKIQDYEVTGVFEDFPANTHFHPSLLISMETLVKEWGVKLTWVNGGFHTYVLLRKGTDAEKFGAKLPSFAQRRAGEELKPWNETMVLNLQRIDTIHLDSHFIWEYEENGDRATTYFMAIIGFLILAIALINYVNLSIAKSMERAKEIGIRKVIGSLRRQLVQQFVVESFVIQSIALVLSVAVLSISAGPLIRWLSISLASDFLLSRTFWMTFGVMVALGVCLSSLYPSFILSNFNIVSVLKGKLSGKPRGTVFFKTLTIVQFSASVALMIIAYCVYAQINFMRRNDNGFSKDRILVLRAPNKWDSLYASSLGGFKRDMLASQGIQYVVATSDIPGQAPALRAGGVRRISDTKELAFDCTPPLVDYNYFEMLDLKILAGRSFSEAEMDDYRKVVINEEALKQLRITSPDLAIGEKITFWRDTFDIIGVVKNYHHESLRRGVLPMVFRFNPLYRGYISVKFSPEHADGIIKAAEEKWKVHFSGFPFDYFFLDENFNNQYKGDQQFEKIVAVFSAIAILITCMGLFGLSLQNLSRRIKEIGIRKVLGGSVSNIMFSLNKDFAVLMAVSVVIAIPVGWLVVDHWQRIFISRVELSGGLFVWPALLAILVSVLSIGVMTFQVATKNPMESLKYE